MTNRHTKGNDFGRVADCPAYYERKTTMKLKRQCAYPNDSLHVRQPKRFTAARSEVNAKPKNRA